MKIVIPTRGRVGQQQTIMSIPKSLHRSVILVCPESEVVHHAHRHDDINFMKQPDPDMSISEKRAWIMQRMDEIGEKKILMLDDDLFFYVRRLDRPDRLRDANEEDVEYWFDQIEQKLSPDIPHAGFGPRQGNHTFPSGWHVGRMMLALGYHVPTVNKFASFGRVRFREDMDVCLQLLRAGLPNAVCHEFAVGQRSYGAPGGCDNERTVEKSDADAERLSELHPGLVRVTQKEYKGHPRKEVIVQWKRALQEGTLRRNSESSSGQAG